MNNNQKRKAIFKKMREYKNTICVCENYNCNIFKNCMVEIENLKKQSNNYAKRIINALNYINRHAYSNISKNYDELCNGEIEELVNILEGYDKE